MDDERPCRSKKGMRRALKSPAPMEGVAISPGAARPAALDDLSAPVFRFGSGVGSRGRRVLHHQPFNISGHAAMLRGGLLDQQRLKFRRHLEIDRGRFPLSD